MKKPPIAVIGVGALILVALIVAVVVSTHDSKPKQTVAAYKPVNACAILTDSLAKQIAGNDATKAKTPDNNSDSVVLSSCNYQSPSTQIGVGLLARYPTNKEGADSNSSQFKKGLPDDAQNVAGYGDAAYWSTRYGQLNILKHHTWYILDIGSPQPAEHTLDQSKKFAKQIINKL